MSISLSFASLWPTVNTIVNNMWLVFVIPLGIVLGFAILGRIIKEVKTSVGHV
jgi:hypothetical protein